MHTTDNGRAAWSRANQRLRRLTIGTAVLGAVATGGLGWVAAETSAGTGTAATTRTTTTGSAATAPAATNTTTTTTTGNQVVVPRVVSGTGGAHASTGGS